MSSAIVQPSVPAESVHNRKKAFVISYNAAISACEKGIQWEQAVTLLREMEERGI